jgi:hypothetical protein
MSIFSSRVAGIDGAIALRMARAIERDPSLLERDPKLVTEIAAYPAAAEMLKGIFAARKKVAFRYQNARAQFAAFA